MPNPLFNAFQSQQPDFRTQLQQFKAQFGQGADPTQILQQMMQRGQVSQEQVNAAYAQVQQLFHRR